MLQIVGLDAAVVSRTYLSVAVRCFADRSTAFKLLQDVLPVVLRMLDPCSCSPDASQLEGMNRYMPSLIHSYNTQNNIDIGDGREDGGSNDVRLMDPPVQTPGRDWLDLISDANSYLSAHLLFTYLFTGLTLYFIQRNYQRFIKARQLFSLELVHSIAARTVMITRLPSHLQSERALAEYFENMNLSVESVSVCREVNNLQELLDLRTRALLKLESAWVDYLGNPSRAVPFDSVTQPLVDVDGGAAEDQRNRLVVPNRRRPTIRPGWFKAKVDALEYLEEKFKEADELVRKKRQTGKFKATHTAFVTFEKMSSAVSAMNPEKALYLTYLAQQIAVQTVHASVPAQSVTHQAPEPRDIVWHNMSITSRGAAVREVFVLAAMILLFLFWFIPVTALAGLLSFKEIKKTWPALAGLLDANPQIRAIVQNSLPSVAIISLNACLPFILEGTVFFSVLSTYFIHCVSSPHLRTRVSCAKLD